MNYRLTITTAVAVVLASFSLFTVINGAAWLYESAGAVIVVAAAGIATRLPALKAAAIGGVLMLVAVVPLLASHNWAARIGGVALVAVVAASAGIRRFLPALATAGTYLAALLLYLNLIFAGAQSFLLLVPTHRSLHHLAHLASLGYAEHRFAPPVPGILGIGLIAAAGIGVVAILTDIIAIRLRSPAVAGLPLLVLFSVPVATNVKHATIGLTFAFCVGITGYLALLAVDGRQRLRLWGRLVTVWQEAADDEDSARGPDTRALATSGRRIGLAAVALAVVVPAVLPGIREHGIFGKDSVPGAGSGGPVAAAPLPLDQLNSQLLGDSDQPVLTYHTTAAKPAEQYLQIYVLNYDSSSGNWDLASRYPASTVGSTALAQPPGLAAAVATSTSTTKVTFDKAVGYSGAMTYLPLPYAPEFLTAPAGGSWAETNSTLMVYGFQHHSGMSYTVTSRTPAPTPTQLSATGLVPASIKNSYLAYTGPDAAQLRAMARSITAGALNPFAEGEDLEEWFTQAGNFTYSLHAKPPASLLQFLTSDKVGHCQQFALAMATLARLIGIPSRIAIGYTAGRLIGHGTWQVTEADAHAWPELYLPDLGWTRFEPTPGGADGQGTATQPSFAAVNPVNPTPSTSAGTAPNTGPIGRGGKGGSQDRFRPDPGADKGSGPFGGKGHSDGFPIGLTLALIALLLLISPGLGRVATRRHRWRSATDDASTAHAAWRELNSDLVDHGISGNTSESPRAVARRVAAAGDLDEQASQAVQRIAGAEERARYARTPAAARGLREDVHIVRRALSGNASRAQRWRARLAPASTLAPVATGLRQAPDTFGWMDAASLRLRGMVTQRLRPRRTT